MSRRNAGAEKNPKRVRAGHLSQLTRLYKEVNRLILSDGTAEEVRFMRKRIEEQYLLYLESHEETVADNPELEQAYLDAHNRNEARHQLVLDNIDAYLQDGSKPDDSDIESYHDASALSIPGTVSVASSSVASSRNSKRTASSRLRSHASGRKTPSAAPTIRSLERSSKATSQAKSDRISEARVQAELQELRAKQMSTIHEMEEKQRLFEIERETHRLKMELQQQKFAHDLERERQQSKVNELKAEVQLRQREVIRSEIGSDYGSDAEREDVTRPKTAAPKPKQGWLPEAEQTALMQKIHQSYRDYGLPAPAPEVLANVASEENLVQEQYLSNSIPRRVGYTPPTNPTP
jgi:hypothetical protein